MGGQVLGGGVIVLVCALLWLVYLVPSWAQRYRYDAAERNAMRMSRALRVMAEASEMPAEVEFELNTRTAYQQQRLARRLQAERDRAQAQMDAATQRTTAAQAALARRTHREREQARLEQARRELFAARSEPAARRARARTRARVVSIVVAVAAVALLSAGVWTVVQGGTQVWLWAGVSAVVAWSLLARRIAVVSRRPVAVATESVPARVSVAMQDVELEQETRAWAPRTLPKPLSASAGSRAAAHLDVVAARDALRQAGQEEALRERAAAQHPPSIAAARARAELSRTAGDAEIEAHVRDLLQRRASGQ